MKRLTIFVMSAIWLVGCAPAKPKAVDPCASAPSVCWGRAGVMPSDVSVCAQVASCHDWEMRAR